MGKHFILRPICNRAILRHATLYHGDQGHLCCMESLGTMLRRARVAQGRDLAEVADQIKVHPRYLEALEADDLKSLPGGFFYKSFVRQYASALGMDPGRVEHALAQVQVAEPVVLPNVREDQPILKDIKPMPAKAMAYPGLLIFNGLLPSIGVLLLVMVACGGFYVWWHRLETRPATENGERRVSRVLPPEPETPPAPTPAADTPAPTPTPAASEPASEPATTPEPATGSGVKVTLTATGDSWVRVWADGKSVFTGLMKAQETKSFEASDSARVRTGNAEALAIYWNGKQLEFPGPPAYVRDVSFTRDSWQNTPGAPLPSHPAETQPQTEPEPPTG